MAPTLLDLANVGDDPLGATEAIKNLLQVVGRDIVTLQRNTNVSYMVAERAQDIAKAINECIIKVEESETEDWVNFERFSNAIDPLEDVLLKLLSFADDEKERYLAETTSITTCIASPETWKVKREEISKILKEFHTTQELGKLLKVSNTQESDKHAQFYDDKSLLEEMRTKIKAVLSKEPKEFPTYVYDIETPLDNLQSVVISGSSQSQPSEWLVILAIQTSMLIEGVVEILKKTSDIETRNHLKSKPVWDAALALINFLVDNKSLPNSPGDADERYQTFITALTALAKLALPANYVQLMRKVGHIRRPFQAQAITVVMLCHTLAKKFGTLQKPDINIEKFDNLEKAINKTLQALQGATEVAADLKSFNTSDLDKHPTVKEFGVAEDLIKGSFYSLDLGDEWKNKQTDLRDAITKDKTRLTELQKRFNKGPSDLSEKVKVTVTIHEDSPNGPALKTTLFEGEKTMRLSALRWSVAGELAEDNKKHAARTTGSFFDQSGDEKGVHSTIGEIAGGGLVVTLKLVVPVAPGAQELAAKTAAQERAALELAAKAAAQERAAQEFAAKAAAQERAAKAAAAQERAAQELASKAAVQERAAKAAAAQELASKAAAQERADKAAAAQELASKAAAQERAAKAAAAKERAAKAAAAKERAVQERAAKATTS